MVINQRIFSCVWQIAISASRYKSNIWIYIEIMERRYVRGARTGNSSVFAKQADTY